MNGLELWEKVEKTNPKHTRRRTLDEEGLRGTAIKPIYLKEITELGAYWRRN